MDKKKLESYKTRLLQERERIMRALNQNEVEFEGTTTSRSAEFEEASRVDRDKEYISSLLSKDTDILTDIEDALKRIDEGTFGRCIDTGKDIPEPRLDAMPWTPRCREAQEAYEIRRRVGDEE
ncbi:MAG: TraR/DksA C4-type zinc finger protein [candidate division KSB1 bacterium]